jgi:hypothetical protein
MSFADVVAPASPIGPEDKQHDEGRLERAGSDANNVTVSQLTAEQEKKLWRKVDLRLMPILSLMYLVAFLDRGA